MVHGPGGGASLDVRWSTVQGDPDGELWALLPRNIYGRLSCFLKETCLDVGQNVRDDAKNVRANKTNTQYHLMCEPHISCIFLHAASVCGL